MDNLNLPTSQEVKPEIPMGAPMEAPMEAPIEVQAEPMVAQELPKPSHIMRNVLVVVLVMAGALGAVQFFKPELITTTIAWVTNSTQHAAAPENQVPEVDENVVVTTPEAVLPTVENSEVPPADGTSLTSDDVAVEEVVAEEAPKRPGIPKPPVEEPAPSPEMLVVPAETTEPSAPANVDQPPAQGDVLPAGTAEEPKVQ